MFTFVGMGRGSKGRSRASKRSSRTIVNRLNKQNRIQKGKLYTFTAGLTTEMYLYATPSIYSRFMGAVRKDAVLMVLDIHEQTAKPDDLELRKYIQVLHGEVVGWLACGYTFQFQANKFLKAFHP